MNRSRVVLLAILGVVVVLIATFGVIYVTSNSDNDPTIPPEAMETHPLNVEWEEATLAFPEVSEVDGWSPEAVQLALNSVQRYVKLAFNDPALTNGTWHQNNFDKEHLESRLAKYFTPTAWEEIAVKIDALSGSNDASLQAEVLRELFPIFFVLDTRGQDFEPNPDCVENPKISCLEGGGPILRDWQYSRVESPDTLSIAVTVESPMIYKRVTSGEIGKVVFTHDIRFEVTPNVLEERNNGEPAFVIKSMGSDWNSTGWQAL